MDISRLKSDLVWTSRFGRNSMQSISNYHQLNSDKGVTRPTGSRANKKIRDYAVEAMKNCGLHISIDSCGNIFGRKEGIDKKSASVMCGSHLDSVINGGHFDGALGVFSAIEAIRRLNDENFQNKRPLEVVVFTGEEGSAFGETLLGSAAFTGFKKAEKVLQLKNRQAKDLKEALQAIGYQGQDKKNVQAVDYFLEMHIEQGPVLYEENVPIGIVESINGLMWIYITINGEPNHAGTTPMDRRKDALLAASEIIQLVHIEAKKRAELPESNTVGTVGQLTVSPNGINIVPGTVEMGVDIRDKKAENITCIKEKLIEKIKQLKIQQKLKIGYHIPTALPPQPLSTEVMAAIQTSAQTSGIKYRFINSGATHDAQNMARATKTGMIFLPSVNGISHAPMEWTRWDDIEKGVQVLTNTLKILANKQ